MSSPIAESGTARGWFVTASGTASGKTMVSRSIVHALARRGFRVAGVKPFETGCAPYPLDALALASASGDEGLANRAAWYRAEPPLAPYAVELTTGFAAPKLDAITAEVRRLEAAHDRVVVEGAGGVLVPIDRERSMADVMAMIGYPVLLVADDRLGVLSYLLTAYECLLRRGQRVTAIVLNQASEPDPSDPSAASNRTILAERVQCAVIAFPHLREQQPDALADAAEASGMIDVLESLGSSANR